MTISLPPATGLIMMAGIYHGAKFAGATTSILLNIPAETSSVVLCLDGHPLARKGRAGPAMGMSAIAGFIASTFGVVALTFAAPSSRNVALGFGPPEYAALMGFGLLLVILLASDSPIKGFLSMCIGLLVSTIGIDIFTGQQRLTFGVPALYDGIDFIADQRRAVRRRRGAAQRREEDGPADLRGAEGHPQSVAHQGRPQAVPAGDRTGYGLRLLHRRVARRWFDRRVASCPTRW